LIIFNVLFLVLASAVTCVYPEIKARDSEIIRTAYMNGYVAALNLDVDAIQSLKGDEALLKKTVESAADNYLGVVSGMNK
jgi:hypothetical protein